MLRVTSTNSLAAMPFASVLKLQELGTFSAATTLAAPSTCLRFTRAQFLTQETVLTRATTLVPLVQSARTAALGVQAVTTSRVAASGASFDVTKILGVG